MNKREGGWYWVKVNVPENWMSEEIAYWCNLEWMWFTAVGGYLPDEVVTVLDERRIVRSEVSQ